MSSNGNGTAEKTGKKTGTANRLMVSPRSGAAIPTGAHPANTGGKPGRSGRKADEFKRRMAALATFAEKSGFLATVISNPDHPHFMSAVKYVTEYGYGKVPQAHEHSGKVGGRFTFVIEHPRDSDG